MIYIDTSKKYSYLFASSVMSYSISGVLMFVSLRLLGRTIYGAWLYLFFWMTITIKIFCEDTSDIRFRTYFKTLLLYGAFLVIMYLLFPDTRVFFTEYRNDLIFVMSYGLMAFSIIKNEQDIHQLIIDCMPIFRFAIVILSISVVFGSANQFGTMWLGLRITPALLLFYYCVKYTYSGTLDKAIVVIGFIASLFANRQTLLMVGIGLCLIWLFCGEKNDIRKNVIRFMAFMAVIIIAVLFWQYILNGIAFVITSLGINGKGVTSLIDGTLLDSSNRNSIYEYCVEIIGKNGKNVSGLFADRLYLRQYRSNIAYAHNFVYEILIDFGTVLGTIILVVLSWLFVRKLIKCPDKILVLVIFLAFFARLLVSDSIITSVLLWPFLGMLLNKSNYYSRLEESVQHDNDRQCS